jgi:hypothetical protein
MMIMAARRDIRSGVVRACALLGAAVLCALPARAGAEVRILETGAGSVVVEARDATVEEVLEALSASQNFEFRTSRALPRVLTGTYSGTLPRVLARVLDGYDHVIRSSSSGIQLNVVGVAGPARPMAAGARAPARPVMTAMAVGIGNAVSSNVDLDEENAQVAMAGAAPVKGMAASRPIASSIPTDPAALTGSMPGSAGPRISSNVDLDEETSH